MTIRTITILSLCIPLLVTAQLDPNLESSFNTALDNQFEQNLDFGISASVIMPDETLWIGSRGIDQMEEPMNHISVFFGGGIMKMHIATVIYQMVEGLFFDLDDPISMYLGEMDHINPETTIQHLLNHSSGIYDLSNHPDFYNTALNNPDKIFEPQELLNTFLNQDPTSPLGAQFSLSNTNYILLGMIIEEVSGQRLENFIKFRIWDQIELVNTFWGSAEQYGNSFAGLWADYDNDGELTAHNDIGYNALLSQHWSTGNIVTIPLDAVRFMRGLYNGDVLDRSLLDQMEFVDESLFSGFSPLKYGSGLMRLAKDRDILYGHTGDIGNPSYVYHSPEYNYTIAVMSNTQTNSSMAFDAIQTAIIDFLNPATNVHKTDIKKIITHPNPTHDYISFDINLDAEMNIKIITMNGDVLIKSIKDNRLDVSFLAPGMYLVRLEGAENVYQSKFVKM